MLPLKNKSHLNGQKNIQKSSDKIVIPTCDTYEILKLDDIVRLEGLQNYSKIFLKSSVTLTSTNTLGYYKMTLESYGFVSCHRSHIVNMANIIKYHKEGSVDMIDKSSVPVSRRMKADFLKRIMERFIS